MNTLLSFGIHHIWKHSAIRMLGLKQGDKVIDVCGGTADLSIIAGNAVGPSGQIFVYDINNAMMEAGSDKVTSASMSDLIKFVQGDAEQISFRDGYFDAAMVGFGIRNLTKIENGLKEICRVLKPNGKFMCLEFSRPTSSFLRFFYNIYSFYVMPLIGKLFTGYKQAYTYLPESIRTFPLPDQFSSMLEQAGFCNVNYTKCTNGIAVIHLGTKK
jgi:demethylmenaquinone methyltransferase/2-methoxy-6-polyprenyl-1,4-benzoquinol methylase